MKAIKEAREQFPPLPNNQYFSVDEDGLLCVVEFKQGKRIESPLPNNETWYAVSVPGTILCPWDADFSRIYCSRDRAAIKRLCRAVQKHEEAATAVIKLLQ